MSLETKRIVICAIRPRSSAAVTVAPSIETKARFSGFAAALAFADGGVESVKDLPRQQAAQLTAIAFGKGGDNHLVGGARAG